MQPMPPQPSPPPSGGSETAISPGEIVLWSSAGVALIFSFFGWTSFDGASNANAWSGGDLELNVFPLATYVPLFIIASASISLLKRFGNVSFGLEQYIGLSGQALQRAFAWFAFLIAFGWLLFIDENRGIGLWFSILAAIGAVVGNVLIDRLPAKPKAVATPGQWGAPPAPGGYPQQPGYAAPQPPPQQPPAPQPPAPAPQPQPQPPAPQPPPPSPAPPPSPQPPPPAPPGPGTPPPPPPPG